MKTPCIYVLYATHQGGFEILRSTPQSKRKIQSLQTCADADGVRCWFNSTPSLFLQPSEWRVIADYADPISCNITIPDLGRQDSRRFLQQRLQGFESQAPWLRAAPLLGHIPASRLVTHWLSRIGWHSPFPRRWVAHVLPSTPLAANLHNTLKDLTQRPKTRIQGPFLMADLLAHSMPLSTSGSTACIYLSPTSSTASSALVTLQQDRTVLFSRRIDNSAITPTQLLPTLYAHQLLDRQSDPPAIETVAPGVYPEQLLHWLAQADTRTLRKLSAFTTRQTEAPHPVPQQVKQWLRQRPFTSTAVAVLLASVSLLTGASAFHPSHSKPSPTRVQIPAPLISERTETTPTDEAVQATPEIDLNAALPNQPTASAVPENEANASYGWIRRSDGMVLRWHGDPTKNEREQLNRGVYSHIQNTWTLRRATP